MTTEIVFAKQGIRQNGFPLEKDKTFLTAGDKIVIPVNGDGLPDILTMPIGTVGIVHDDDVNKISIVRDDCQAARRAKNKLARTSLAIRQPSKFAAPIDGLFKIMTQVSASEQNAVQPPTPLNKNLFRLSGPMAT